MTNWLFFFDFVVLCSTFSSQCQICQLSHHRLPDFDGKSVSDFPLTTQGGLGKLWMCTRMCSEDSRCRSYRYNSMTGACSTYGVGYSIPGKTFNTVTMETGSQLYLMCGETRAYGTACSSASDCEFSGSTCQNGSCKCSLGYSYDTNTGDCATQCAGYTDFFELYPDHGVDGCNVHVTNQPTGDACMETCRDHTAFVCINAEYEASTGACQMCDEAWFDLIPEARVTDDYDWNLYYRLCVL